MVLFKKKISNFMIFQCLTYSFFIMQINNFDLIFCIDKFEVNMHKIIFLKTQLHL